MKKRTTRFRTKLTSRLRPPFRCVECDGESCLATGDVLFGRSAEDRLYWLCRCGAYIGCLRGTDLPSGLPAGRRTKMARIEAHAAFDLLWKKHGIPRTEAYRMLASHFEITFHDCHFGSMGLKACREAIQWTNNIIADLNHEPT